MSSVKEYRNREDVKILIIEDDAVIAISLKLRFQKEGYKVCETAANEKQSIQIFNDEDPDIVLSDIILADDDNGMTIVGKLRDTNSSLPIIFLTGYEIDEIEDQAMKFNPLGFFIKPADINEVSNVIDAFFKITTR